MSSRHVSRSIALQTLFEWDFRGQPAAILPAILERNLTESGEGLNEYGFTQELLDGVLNNLEKIDSVIVKYAPEWPVEQITIIDRNILRLGIFELTINKLVPPKVIINEAIELAKNFGGPSSGRFINGVLGTVFKDQQPTSEQTTLDHQSKPTNTPDVSQAQ